MELGGGEVLNSARAVGYTSTAPCPINWLQCPPCDGIRDVLGDDAYTYELISQAPWYDAEDETTHRFLGASALSVEGLPDSTREAKTAEATLDGGVVGRVRFGTRRMRYRAVLSAIGEDALEAGFDWLSSALSPGKCGIHADACGAADMHFYTACPPARAEVTMPETFWNDPITNLATNPSMETAGPATVVRTNLATNPSFEQATAATVEVRRNLANNPSFEGGGGVVTIHRNEAPNPSFEAVTAATAEVRRNMFFNPGFNADVGGGWGAEAGVTRAWQSSGGRTSPGAMLVTKLENTNASAGIPCMATAVIGQSYTFSAYFKNVSGDAKPYLLVNKGSGDYVETTALILNNQWQRASITFTATGTDIVVFIQGGFSTVAGSSFLADDTLLEKSAALGAYFDGSTPAAGDFSHAWVGAPNASASAEYGTGVPSMAAGNGGVPIFSSEWASSGSKSMRIVATSSATTQQFADYQTNSILAGSFKPNTVYTIMGKIRLIAPQAGTLDPDARSLFVHLNGNTYVDHSTPGAQAPNVAGVHSLRATFRTPATFSLYNTIRLMNGAHAGNGDVWWDDFAIVEGNYTGPYFDGSTPAKVRRNLAMNPGFENMNGLSPASFGDGNGTSALANGVWSKNWTVAPSGNSGYFDFGGSAGPGGQNYQSTLYPVRQYTASVWFRSNRLVTMQYLAVEHAADGTQYLYTGPSTVVQPNIWTLLYYTGVSGPDTRGLRSTLIQADMPSANSPIPQAGDKWEISQSLVENDVSTPGVWFDGRTNVAPYTGAWDLGPAWSGGSPSYLYDSDFTYAWLGTANDSQSDMRGDFVAGVDSANQGNSLSALTRSTQWHSDRTRSLRIIPVGSGDGSDSDTGATVAGSPSGMTGYGVTFVAGRTYTVSAKIRLVAAQIGSINPRARRIHFADAVAGWDNPAFMSPQAPNAAGETRLSLTFTVSAGATWACLRLYNGAMAGNGDVWWDDLIITESAAVSPYFDGSTVPSSPDLPRAWVGTADLSASVEYGTQVPATVGFNSALVQSAEWAKSGSKSLRIIPTAKNADTNASIVASLTVGKTYTVIATSRLTAPQTGSLFDARARRIVLWEGGSGVDHFGTPAPNAAGVTEHRLTFTPQGSNYAIYLYNGAEVGGGDVWWDDVAIVEGVYTGPYFDGSNPGKVRRNLIPNPSFEVDTAGWSPGGAVSLARSTAKAKVGAASMLVTVTGPGHYPTVMLGFPSKIGQTYSLRVSLSAGTSERGINVQLGPTDNQTQVIPGVGWTDATISYKATETTTMIYIFGGTNYLGGESFHIDAVLVEPTTTPGPFFDGSTPAANGVKGAWEGTPNNSPSYLADPDFTYAWTGPADASTSEQKAPGVVAPIPGSLSFGTGVIQSSEWADDRTKSMRLTSLDTGDSGYQFGGYNFATFEHGKTYTLAVTVHQVGPQPTEGVSQLARSLVAMSDAPGFVQQVSTAPNVAGTTRLSVTFTVPSTGGSWCVVRFYHGAPGGTPDIWLDSVMLIEGNYAGGPYFDGSFPDSTPEDLEVIGKNVARYDWTGTADASTSTYTTGTVVAVPDPVEYQRILDRMARHLHTVTCVSGPTVEQKLHRGDTWGYVVEFVLVAAVPWMFGTTKPVTLQPSLPVVVQDVPFNLVPYPSAELESGTVIAAKNWAQNPSVEVDGSNWAHQSSVVLPGDVTSGRSTALAAQGSASFRAHFVATNAGSGGRITIGHTTATFPPTVAGQRMSVNIWANRVIVSGTPAVGQFLTQVVWRAGTTVLRTDSMTTLPPGGGPVSMKSIAVPVGTDNAIVQVFTSISLWAIGDTVDLYADAIAVTVP